MKKRSFLCIEGSPQGGDTKCISPGPGAIVRGYHHRADPASSSSSSSKTPATSEPPADKTISAPVTLARGSGARPGIRRLTGATPACQPKDSGGGGDSDPPSSYPPAKKARTGDGGRLLLPSSSSPRTSEGGRGDVVTIELSDSEGEAGPIVPRSRNEGDGCRVGGSIARSEGGGRFEVVEEGEGRGGVGPAATGVVGVPPTVADLGLAQNQMHKVVEKMVGVSQLVDSPVPSILTMFPFPRVPDYAAGLAMAAATGWNFAEGMPPSMESLSELHHLQQQPCKVMPISILSHPELLGAPHPPPSSSSSPSLTSDSRGGRPASAQGAASGGELSLLRRQQQQQQGGGGGGGGGPVAETGEDPALSPHRRELEAIGRSLQVQVDNRGYMSVEALGAAVSHNLPRIAGTVHDTALACMEKVAGCMTDRVRSLYMDSGMVIPADALISTVDSLVMASQQPHRGGADSLVAQRLLHQMSAGSALHDYHAHQQKRMSSLPEDARRAREAVTNALGDTTRTIKQRLDHGMASADERRGQAEQECIVAYRKYLSTLRAVAAEQENLAKDLLVAQMKAERSARLIEEGSEGVRSSHMLPLWIWLRARRVDLPARCRLTGKLLAMEPSDGYGDDEEEKEEEEEEEEEEGGKGDMKARVKGGESGKAEVPKNMLWITVAGGEGGTGAGMGMGMGMGWSPCSGGGAMDAVIYPQLVGEIIHRVMYGLPARGGLPPTSQDLGLQQHQHHHHQQNLGWSGGQGGDGSPIPSPMEHGITIWKLPDSPTSSSSSPSPLRPLSTAAPQVKVQHVVPRDDVLRIVLHDQVKAWWRFAQCVPMFFAVAGGVVSMQDERSFEETVRSMLQMNPFAPPSYCGGGGGGDGGYAYGHRNQNQHQQHQRPMEGEQGNGAQSPLQSFDRGATMDAILSAYRDAYSLRNCPVPPRYRQDIVTHYRMTGAVPTKTMKLWPEPFKRFWMAYTRVQSLGMDAMRKVMRLEPAVFVNPDVV